jgi:agmatinase
MYHFNVLGITIFLYLTATSNARQIVFPPSIGIDAVPSASTTPPGLGLSRPFAGLMTFANLPYVHCLADAESEDVEKFDIAFLGAPFDTVGLCCLSANLLRVD